MPDSLFRTALRLRLGLFHPHFSTCATCECGAALGVEGGIHVILCATKVASIAVHNTVRDCVASLTREAGLCSIVEPVGILPLRPGDTLGRRPDLACSDPARGPHLLLDVTTVDPLQRAVLGTAAVERGSAAAAKARERARHHADHYAGDAPLLLAAEVFGALDVGFDKFSQMCAGKASLRHYGGGPSRPYGKVIALFRHLLSVSLQRAQASALLSHSAGSLDTASPPLTD